MKKKLNLFDLISFGVGTIIGSGIFSLLGYGIAYTGRSITIALFVSMLLVLPCLASVILTTYCFVSNDFKLTVTVITIVIFAYGIIRAKSDKITIRAKEEFKAK